MLPTPTERIRFRVFREDDAANVLEQFADAQARKFYANFDSLEAAGQWISWAQQRQDEHGYSLWVLESLEDGRYLGDCGILLQEVEGEPLIEVGYHLRAAERGRGFASEAARHCLALAFEELKPPLVGSLVHPDNEPSARVAGCLHASERSVHWREERYRLFFTERA